jgi:hypothetical protein
VRFEPTVDLRLMPCGAIESEKAAHHGNPRPLVQLAIS